MYFFCDLNYVIQFETRFFLIRIYVHISKMLELNMALQNLITSFSIKRFTFQNFFKGFLITFVI